MELAHGAGAGSLKFGAAKPWLTDLLGWRRQAPAPAGTFFMEPGNLAAPCDCAGATTLLARG